MSELVVCIWSNLCGFVTILYLLHAFTPICVSNIGVSANKHNKFTHFIFSIRNVIRKAEFE